MKYLKIKEWAELGNLFWDRVGYFRREQSDEELIVSFCNKYLQQFDEYESSDNSFTYIDAARAYYTSLLLVHCTTHINNVDRVLFRDKALLTYSEFLNVTQYFGYMAHRMHPETQNYPSEKYVYHYDGLMDFLGIKRKMAYKLGYQGCLESTKVKTNNHSVAFNKQKVLEILRLKSQTERWIKKIYDNIPEPNKTFIE